MKAGATLETYLLAVVRGKQTGWKAKLVLLVLGLLEVVYWLVFKFKYLVTRHQELPVPVISVGNITAGGTGKTPAVVWIVETLLKAGLRPAVLTRGYRGSAQQEGRIISAADLSHLTAAETGDEPYLLAKLLPGVTVAIGRDRYRMGQRALQVDPDIDLFVLDDGFQFFRLRRQLDLVLLDAVNPFDNGHLLPRGLLREPLSALRRAGMVMLTRSEQVGPETVARIVDAVKRYHPRVLTAEARSVNDTVVELARWGEPLAPMPAAQFLKGRRIGLVTAIGNPGQLQAGIEKLGAEIACLQSFPDHHFWNAAEIAAIITALKAAQVTEVVITAKDAVKLIPYSANFQSGNIGCYILNLAFEVAEAAALAKLLSVCPKKG